MWRKSVLRLPNQQTPACCRTRHLERSLRSPQQHTTITGSQLGTLGSTLLLRTPNNVIKVTSQPAFQLERQTCTARTSSARVTWARTYRNTDCDRHLCWRATGNDILSYNTNPQQQQPCSTRRETP